MITTNANTCATITNIDFGDFYKFDIVISWKVIKLIKHYSKKKKKTETLNVLVDYMRTFN